MQRRSTRTSSLIFALMLPLTLTGPFLVTQETPGPGLPTRPAPPPVATHAPRNEPEVAAPTPTPLPIRRVPVTTIPDVHPSSKK